MTRRAGGGRGDDGRRRVFRTWPPEAWRSGVTTDRGVDIDAVLVSIQTYDIATVERGWSPVHLQRWWHRTLTEQLLA